MSRRAQHLRLLETQQIVAREALDQFFEERRGRRPFLLAPIDHAEEDLRVDAVGFPFVRNFLQRADAPLSIAPKPDQESQHLVKRRQAPDDVIVRALHQSRIVVGRIQLGHAVVHLARRGGVVQRFPPGFADQEVPIAA